MAVPNIFATQTGTIPLAALDTNFATPVTIGVTSVALGSTITSVSGLTLAAPTFTGTVTSSGQLNLTNASNYNLYASGTAANYLAGDLQLAKTVTAGGTTGARTINKTTGTVNFAAAATSLVVTNSLVTTSSIIIATVGTNDTTMKSVQVVAGAGSFTIYASAAATAETRVNFLITN